MENDPADPTTKDAAAFVVMAGATPTVIDPHTVVGRDGDRVGAKGTGGRNASQGGGVIAVGVNAVVGKEHTARKRP
jgi:hypothetical protein